MTIRQSYWQPGQPVFRPAAGTKTPASDEPQNGSGDPSHGSGSLRSLRADSGLGRVVTELLRCAFDFAIESPKKTLLS